MTNLTVYLANSIKRNMAIDLILRSMIEEDLYHVNVIYNEAVIAGFQTADIDPITAEKRMEWFRKHVIGNYPLMVALRDDQIVGWISISPYREGRMALKHTCEISYYIGQKNLGLGIGSQLMQGMLELLKNYPFNTLIAILIDRNERSIRLLEKYDFQRWGVLPNVLSFEEIECSHLYYGLRIKF
ncbi:GNAT family N-acetyltransferase [soil metagenome]